MHFLGASSCTGDAGGAMVTREYTGKPRYQVGITSFNLEKKCEKGTIGFYTKVDTFLPWIENNLQP